MLSRLVCSISNGPTSGVNLIPAGKCALAAIGATKPGPRKVELGSVMFGSESTSRSVIVDWARSCAVRDVSAALSVAKKGPRPGLGQGAIDGEDELLGAPRDRGRDVPLDADTPAVAPVDRPTATIASSPGVTCAARESNVATSCVVSNGPAAAAVTPAEEASRFERMPASGRGRSCASIGPDPSRKAKHRLVSYRRPEPLDHVRSSQPRAEFDDFSGCRGIWRDR